MAREPEDRYATMSKFVEGLDCTRSVERRRDRTRDRSPVLPFANMSGDAENEYFSDGISEEIINALAQLPELHVAARTSAFSFKGRNVDLRAIGDQLSVATVLEGSVRKAGNRLRITAQLIDVADGYHLWSERYDRELTDVFAIQDEIASAIAAKLNVTLAARAGEQLVKPPTDDVDAYDAYLRGRALMQKRGASLAGAVESLERAVAIDPRFAAAHALPRRIARAHELVGHRALRDRPGARNAVDRDVGRARPERGLVTNGPRAASVCFVRSRTGVRGVDTRSGARLRRIRMRGRCTRCTISDTCGPTSGAGLR